jgi:hypothetical protein
MLELHRFLFRSVPGAHFTLTLALAGAISLSPPYLIFAGGLSMLPAPS